ncbi:MAG TPA: DoxX family protein [Rhabdochlamydiaceae bacterium]|nr:DoxX family protein [Rhabdochlamydiaceae bacterium]
MFNFLRSAYSVLVMVGNFLQPFLLLFIRLFWGWMFIRTGLGKLTNMDQVISYFESLGIGHPAFSAYVASLIEFLCGICLFFGFASRLVAIPLIINMIVAYLTAEARAFAMFFSDMQNFVTRTPFTFLFASILIFVFGPGPFSIDFFLGRFFGKKGKSGETGK